MPNLSLSEMHKASYKEVTFLVDGGTVNGGRKLINHVYPNSDRQTIEDLGLRRRTYSVQAIITGDDYLVKRNNLLRVLEEKGTGTLSHPFYGDVVGLAVANFTVNETFSELGKATFNISFVIDTDKTQPLASDINQAGILTKNDTVREKLKQYIANGVSTTDQFTGSFEKTSDKTNQFIGAFKTATAFMNDITDNANKLSANIGRFSNNTTSLIKAPSDLADAIDDLFSAADGATQSIEKTLTGFQELFGFGNDDPPIINIVTAANEEQQRNIAVLNDTINSLALSWSYVNVSLKSFQTEDEVTEDQERLEVQYQIVINSSLLTSTAKNANDVINPLTSLNTSDFSVGDVTDSLNDIRTLTMQFLEEVKRNAAQTVLVKTKVIPMRVLSFQYYDDSTQFSELNQINKDPNVSFISGEVNILSDIT